MFDPKKENKMSEKNFSLYFLGFIRKIIILFSNAEICYNGKEIRDTLIL